MENLLSVDLKSEFPDMGPIYPGKLEIRRESKRALIAVLGSFAEEGLGVLVFKIEM